MWRSPEADRQLLESALAAAAAVDNVWASATTARQVRSPRYDRGASASRVHTPRFAHSANNTSYIDDDLQQFIHRLQQDRDRCKAQKKALQVEQSRNLMDICSLQEELACERLQKQQQHDEHASLQDELFSLSSELAQVRFRDANMEQVLQQAMYENDNTVVKLEGRVADLGGALDAASVQVAGLQQERLEEARLAAALDSEMQEELKKTLELERNLAALRSDQHELIVAHKEEICKMHDCEAEACNRLEQAYAESRAHFQQEMVKAKSVRSEADVEQNHRNKSKVLDSRRLRSSAEVLQEALDRVRLLTTDSRLGSRTSLEFFALDLSLDPDVTEPVRESIAQLQVAADEIEGLRSKVHLLQADLESLKSHVSEVEVENTVLTKENARLRALVPAEHVPFRCDDQGTPSNTAALSAEETSKAHIGFVAADDLRSAVAASSTERGAVRASSTSVRSPRLSVHFAADVSQDATDKSDMTQAVASPKLVPKGGRQQRDSNMSTLSGRYILPHGGYSWAREKETRNAFMVGKQGHSPDAVESFRQQLLKDSQLGAP